MSLSTSAGSKGSCDEGTEESSSSSSSSSPTEQQSVSLSPLTSMPQDFRAALDAFRKDWQREIKASTNVDPTRDISTAPATGINVKETDDEALAQSLFRQAVELEQRGKVYDALPLYRRAIQKVPDIEFKYYEQQKLLHANETRTKEEVKQVQDTTNYNEGKVENLLEKFEADVAQDYNGRLILSSRDAGVLSTSLHISDLPTELLLYILRWVISTQLDVRSLENCAAVCKGLYICARDEEIWRLACVRVWGANVGTLTGTRIMDNNNEEEGTTKRYASWRRMFIDRERVLYHGCYINKTTYLRMGENSFQDQFYRPIQLVEYYRYMRFLSDGTVLVMTTADEPPVGVVKLKNIYQTRMDVKRGHYYLKDNKLTVVVVKQQQQHQQSTQRQRRANITVEDTNSTTYRLEFRIVSTSKRKFSKLMWQSYSIVTVRNKVENITEFDITPAKYPPLSFSAVRSYHLDTDAPLA